MYLSVYNMTIQYDNIKPWGRSFNEYVRMFNLTPEDLKRKIMGCGDGPASFNAEFTERGGIVKSVDPIYCFSADQIKQRINEIYDENQPSNSSEKQLLSS